MKNQLSNIAFEGTCNGDVMGGLLLWAGENLQALLFSTPRDRHVRLKGVPAGEPTGRKWGIDLQLYA